LGNHRVPAIRRTEPKQDAVRGVTPMLRRMLAGDPHEVAVRVFGLDVDGDAHPALPSEQPRVERCEPSDYAFHLLSSVYLTSPPYLVGRWCPVTSTTSLTGSVLDRAAPLRSRACIGRRA